MTKLQIEKREQEIRSKISKGCLPTPRQSKELAELQCRNMINSCLTYGSSFFAPRTTWKIGVGRVTQSYAEDYYDQLSADRIIQLYNEQSFDFSQATVIHNAFIDSEGLSYNAVKWADEQ